MNTCDACIHKKVCSLKEEFQEYEASVRELKSKNTSFYARAMCIAYLPEKRLPPWPGGINNCVDLMKN